MSTPESVETGFRHRLHTVIFEADTKFGKAFDVALLIAILVSVVAVCLESVPEIRASHGPLLRSIEWGLTVAFSLEYLLRLACVRKPLKYALSFYGIVDLLAILPTYLSLVLTGAQSLLVIRALRLLRVFRVLKLGHFVVEAESLSQALARSRRKILVFLGAVLTMILILGTLMYLVEGGENGFTSIPTSIYWAIVTTTTVGYGDIAPVTVLGKFIASAAMILGYAILAVPTGIVGAELWRGMEGKNHPTTACPGCGTGDHDADARYCKRCGTWLHPEVPRPG